MGHHTPKVVRLLYAASILLATLSAMIAAGILREGVSAFSPRGLALGAAAVIAMALLGLLTAVLGFALDKTSRPEELTSGLGVWLRRFIEWLLGPEMPVWHSHELKLEVLKTQAQVLALQSQINPHFLYNTLESIRGKALLRDEEDIASMTETLALLFRYSVSRGDKNASIADELENVKNFVTIQNYRFRNKFDLRFQVDEVKKILEHYQIPPLTLQPIVENSIHYGLAKKTGRGAIVITGFLTQLHLILQIRDDGVGMEAGDLDKLREKLRCAKGISAGVQEEIRSGTGIALMNVHQRIQLLYGEEYGLEIISMPNIGTQVDVILPAPDLLEKKSHEN